MTKPENPGECQCCGYVTKKLVYFPDLDTTIAGGGKIIRSDFWFCDLCCSTYVSTRYRYPGSSPDIDVMRTVCYVGNVLLAQLEKRTL